MIWLKERAVRLLRDPLAHFLIAGALLFAFFLWRGEPVDPASRTISVGRERQAALVVQFERTMGRAPTDAELDGLIGRFVHEEVLYREALRLGLDRGDPVVRRRLAFKMDQLASARAETEVPSDDVLRKWLADNPWRFAPETIFSFDQLYFAHKDAAKTALTRISSGADWHELGDPLSVPASQESASRRAVATQYGQQFVEQLYALAGGTKWQGPVPSGFGWHLVHLRVRQAGQVPDFVDIRNQVLDEWRTATVATRKQRAYDLLRAAYSVEIAQ